MSRLQDRANGLAVVVDANGAIVCLDTAAKGGGGGSRVGNEIIRGLGADCADQLYYC